jgi:CubicO group peptidase (beta-lactamase class C family)
MLFRLGSTTKMLTATALAGLAAEGKIDLNAPVGRYVSGLPPKLSQVTANQLLSHTAGIHDEAPMSGSHDDSALGKGIRARTDGWLFTEPGKIFSYSNPGYWMAGYLVEA